MCDGGPPGDHIAVGRAHCDFSAALAFADLLAIEAEHGRSVLDRLADIWELAGVWVSSQFSIVRHGVEGQKAIRDAVSRRGDDPPVTMAGLPVSEVVDYRVRADERPARLGACWIMPLLGLAARRASRKAEVSPLLVPEWRGRERRGW
ncbi:MAG: hypothetical protein WB239_19005 [Acidimicrobiia bacterium]